MKTAVYLLAATLFVTGAQEVAAQKKYVLKGVVENGVNGDSVFVQERVARQYQTLAKGVIKNNEFSITGEVTEPIFGVLTYGKDDNQRMVQFFLEEGNINAQLKKNNDAVEGTLLNNAYQQYRGETNAIDQKQNAIEASISETTPPEVKKAKMKEYDELDEQGLAIVKKYIGLNKDNRVGATLLSNKQYMMDYPEISTFLASFTPEIQQLPSMVSLKELCDKAQATAVGQKFTDFTMDTPDGKPMKLSDYAGKGKVVLVDFWASWCGPCRQEMPNIVKAYEQYKDKGFEIVGVSLDRDAKAWKQALTKMNMTWPQMSDLKYWNSEAAKMYVVRSIPHTMLIDKDGTIIARGLHGEGLHTKLAELLK